jgi:hypothetical protein
MSQERRRIPRLTLDDPLEARLSGQSGTLLDISNGGALVEHEFLLKAGTPIVLEFTHAGREVTLSCLVVRTKLGRSVVKPGAFAYSSGLRYSDPTEPARQLVRQIVADVSRRGA